MNQFAVDQFAVRIAVQDSLRESAASMSAIIELHDSVAKAAVSIVEALSRGDKILICGNGGSAADSQHFAAELVGRFLTDRAPLPAIALTTDSSALTAIANDYGVESVFERQVKALGLPGDVLIALSTSGASPNILAAARAAHERKMTSIALTGPGGGQLVAECAHVIAVPTPTTSCVQEGHIAVLHALCYAIEGAGVA